MKKLIGLLLSLLLCGSVSAEMQWLGLNPTPQAGNAGDSGRVSIPSRPTGKGTGSYGGFEVELKIVDSTAGGISADSSFGTYFTYCINTEDVKSATGMFEIISITDTSTTTGHLFALGSADAPAGTGSTFVWYEVKTGWIPYDPDAKVLVSAVEATTVSGAAIRVPITIKAVTVGVDTLFKPYTWIEFTVWDSTRWGEINTASDAIALVDSLITGTWVPADTVVLGGTYDGVELGRYHIRIFDPGGDADSIISTFYGSGDPIVDTTAITGSAQDLDSGMTINFDQTNTATDGDVFIFHVSDSMHYGKTVKYKIRVGLNVQRR